MPLHMFWLNFEQATRVDPSTMFTPLSSEGQRSLTWVIPENRQKLLEERMAVLGKDAMRKSYQVGISAPKSSWKQSLAELGVGDIKRAMYFESSVKFD